ncbi:ribokinase [Paenibacillus sp. GP183]|jgi:ribokinase|uniref:ribokinase n=1 Tax=Paenibacillus sp. GP183 TaxID=1882751 RepID=UPI00089858F1|nr:ribokinase [Paenibacillus sp. GP183]SEC13315.1 ribokinase [Paenibacillus sp. GP183]
MADGDVLVIGSLNMDLVAQVNEMPRVGETIVGNHFDMIIGGKGSNQAVAAARLGSRVSMIGCVGNDAFGDQMVASLTQEKINVTGIRRGESASGTALITVDQHGNNSITVISGANYELTNEDIDRHINLFQDCDVIVLQLEIPLAVVQYCISIGRKFGKQIILNVAPMQKLPHEIFKDINFLVLNEIEAEELLHIPFSQFEQLEKGLSQLGCEHVIWTLGDKGAVYINQGRSVKFDSYKIKAVDTTGAGDSFIGALAGQITRRTDVEDAIRYAVKVSAVTVTKLGAQSSLPTFEEVQNFKQQWGESGE